MDTQDIVASAATLEVEYRDTLVIVALVSVGIVAIPGFLATQATQEFQDIQA